MSTEKTEKKRFNLLDTWDGEYQGNVFGNKVAIWGGLFLLLVLALMVYRHVQMEVPFGGEAPVKEKTEQLNQ